VGNGHASRERAVVRASGSTRSCRLHRFELALPTIECSEVRAFEAWGRAAIWKNVGACNERTLALLRAPRMASDQDLRLLHPKRG
jgi:hypothetical protein